MNKEARISGCVFGTPLDALIRYPPNTTYEMEAGRRIATEREKEPWGRVFLITETVARPFGSKINQDFIGISHLQKI